MLIPRGVAPLEGLVSYRAGPAEPRLIQSRLERGPTASCAINALWVTPARHSRGAAQATNSQKVGCANGTPWAMRARRPRARYDRRGERSLAAAAGKVFVLTFCAAGSGHTASSTRSASAMVAVLFARVSARQHVVRRHPGRGLLRSLLPTRAAPAHHQGLHRQERQPADLPHTRRAGVERSGTGDPDGCGMSTEQPATRSGRGALHPVAARGGERLRTICAQSTLRPAEACANSATSHRRQ